MDKLGAFSSSEGLSSGALSGWSGPFEAVGLDLHKSSLTSGRCEALDTKLDCDLLRSGLSDARFWKVHLRLGGLLARGRAFGRAVEALLGHCACCGLALRGALSRWRTAYRFVQRRYLEVARL